MRTLFVNDYGEFWLLLFSFDSLILLLESPAPLLISMESLLASVLTTDTIESIPEPAGLSFSKSCKRTGLLKSMSRPSVLRISIDVLSALKPDSERKTVPVYLSSRFSRRSSTKHKASFPLSVTSV